MRNSNLIVWRGLRQILYLVRQGAFLSVHQETF